jgi:hypothetical protein
MSALLGFPNENWFFSGIALDHPAVNILGVSFSTVIYSTRIYFVVTPNFYRDELSFGEKLAENWSAGKLTVNCPCGN